jgi:iron complex transport system substrate-binding protein
LLPCQHFGRNNKLPRAWRKKILAVFVATAVLLLFSALRVSAANGSPGGRAQESAAARTVTDETGRSVEVPADVKRIVTLAPNLTEIIYALGLEDKLAGDTDYCDTPAAARTKPHVGSVLNPSLEAIVALHPDLVLAVANSGNRKETVESLDRLGVPVYAMDPHTVRDTLDSIRHIADLAGAAKQGTELAARLQARLDALQARLEELPLAHVLFVIWDEPLITIGQNTLIADALRWAGAESVIASKQYWPEVSLEEVVRLQPDYIVFADEHTDSKSGQLSQLRLRPVWKSLRAVELGHVVTVSEEITRPSPGLIDVIEQLAREVHPNAFAARSETRTPNFEIAPGLAVFLAENQKAAPCAR